MVVGLAAWQANREGLLGQNQRDPIFTRRSFWPKPIWGPPVPQTVVVPVAPAAEPLTWFPSTSKLADLLGRDHLIPFLLYEVPALIGRAAGVFPSTDDREVIERGELRRVLHDVQNPFPHLDPDGMIVGGISLKVRININDSGQLPLDFYIMLTPDCPVGVSDVLAGHACVEWHTPGAAVLSSCGKGGTVSGSTPIDISSFNWSSKTRVGPPILSGFTLGHFLTGVAAAIVLHDLKLGGTVRVFFTSHHSNFSLLLTCVSYPPLILPFYRCLGF